MTQDELKNLPPDQLVSIVLKSQETIQLLQARIDQMERHATGASAPGQTSVTLTAPAIGESNHKRSHRHRHRPWYRKLVRTIFGENTNLRNSLVIILVGLLLAVLLGILVAH